MIRLRGLSKRFGRRQALAGIDLEIERREIVGVVGPDGAGKTTLLRALAGLLDVEAEEAHVLGHDLRGDVTALKAEIGYVPQAFSLHPTLTVAESLRFTARLHGLAEADFRPAADELLARTGLAPFTGRATGALSGGMKQKLAIVNALLARPALLLLDEPTAGVDVELRKGMWDVVRALQASGVTIILTTHYIQEAEEMADRIGVINKGEIILVEDKAGLMQKLGKKELKVHLQGKIDAIPASLAAYNLELCDDGHAVIYDYDTKGDRTGITSLLGDLRNAGIRISDLDTRQSSLEDIFVSLVRAP
jgi:ABC-2 type transport system ATP-binding protein